MKDVTNHLKVDKGRGVVYGPSYMYEVIVYLVQMLEVPMMYIQSCQVVRMLVVLYHLHVLYSV